MAIELSTEDGYTKIVLAPLTDKDDGMSVLHEKAYMLVNKLKVSFGGQSQKAGGGMDWGFTYGDQSDLVLNYVKNKGIFICSKKFENADEVDNNSVMNFASTLNLKI